MQQPLVSPGKPTTVGQQFEEENRSVLGNPLGPVPDIEPEIEESIPLLPPPQPRLRLVQDEDEDRGTAAAPLTLRPSILSVTHPNSDRSSHLTTLSRPTDPNDGGLHVFGSLSPEEQLLRRSSRLEMPLSRHLELANEADGEERGVPPEPEPSEGGGPGAE